MPASELEFRQAERALWRSVDVEPTETWVDLPNGARVRVQIVGDGPPALFLHGGSSSGANFAPLVARLPHLRCLIVDRPGCGLSDPVAAGAHPTGFDAIERNADRLVADLLDGLALERAHLVATSFGGYIALRGAASHPDRVDRVVELAWPMGAPMGYVPMSMRIAAIPGLGALVARVPPTRRAVIAMMKQVGLRGAFAAGRVSDEMLDWFLALLKHTDTMRNEVRSNPKVITPIGGLNERMLLTAALRRTIESPVLFIWGDDDPMGGANVAQTFASEFAEARLEILPGAGHAPWIDDPERCAELVVGHLLA